MLEKNKNDSYILLEKNFANLEKEHEALKVKAFIKNLLNFFRLNTQSLKKNYSTQKSKKK